jgi:hypothetical protein
VSTDQKSHSRREFARRAALLSLVAPIAAPLAAASPLAPPGIPSPTDDQQLPKLPPGFPKLSEQSRAEVEARYDSIVKQYGGRFNDQQKTDVRRLCFMAQPPLDSLRAYTIHNGDGPALYLKPVVEREKKPAKPATQSPAAAAKKP